MEKTGCKIICGAPMTLMVKGLTMMMPLKSYYLNHSLVSLGIFCQKCFDGFQASLHKTNRHYTLQKVVFSE